MGLRLESGARVDTVYFGGGTPTVVAPTLLGRLLAALSARVSLARDAEITVEANPESATGEALRELRAAGFNRLSLGAQSLDDEVLAVLGRRHDAARAVEAIRDARALGWDNIGIDLIFGVPGQSLAQWIGTVQRAIALRPQHVSAYCLTFEPGTPFHRRRAAGELAEVGEELELKMLEGARVILRQAGYDHYEISNFALPGRRGRHNEKYWRGADYVGLGAGAHSGVAGMRWANVPGPADYISSVGRGRLPVCYAERLSGRRRMDEQLVLELRTAEGACLARLGARCGRDAASEYRTLIAGLVESGLAMSDGSHLALTERGMTLGSEVAIRIMA
jgi:oxygen-independent coproporphyrinogen-3 oxidase